MGKGHCSLPRPLPLLEGGYPLFTPQSTLAPQLQLLYPAWYTLVAYIKQ